MRRSAIIVLLFVSSCMLWASCTRHLLVQVEKNDLSKLPGFVSIGQESLKFKAKLSIYDISLTGILATKKADGENILVSFVNEFGVKYFDARINNSKPEMLYCVKKLDKKILTNVVLHDLAVMFLPSVVENVGARTLELGKFSYEYSQEPGGIKQVSEYDSNKVISTFSMEPNGRLKVVHDKPKMSLLLKPI